MRIKTYGSKKRIRCDGYYVGTVRYKEEIASIGIYVVKEFGEDLCWLHGNAIPHAPLDLIVRTKMYRSFHGAGGEIRFQIEKKPPISISRHPVSKSAALTLLSSSLLPVTTMITTRCWIVCWNSFS